MLLETLKKSETFHELETAQPAKNQPKSQSVLKKKHRRILLEGLLLLIILTELLSKGVVE